jgi:MYXO-CTERM domain-containing protein
VEVSFDNTMVEDSDCRPPVVSTQLDFTAVEPLPMVPPLDPEVSAAWTFFPQVDLDDAVCCDGAYPRREYYEDPEWGTGYSVLWEDGYCTAVGGYTDLVIFVDPRFDVPLGEGPFVFGYGGVGYRVAFEPWTEFQTVRVSPEWVHLQVIDLRDGEVIEAEPILAEDPEQDDPDWWENPDIEGDLAENCDGDPYVCEWDETDYAWDPDRCMPYDGSDDGTSDGTADDGSGGDDEEEGDDPPGDTTDQGTTEDGQGGATSVRGCACTTSPTTWGAGLLFFALLGLRRRD